ncbi:hypothetical protein AB1Y20_023674 [Prymnesium parvum]|uniref:C-type lectin domain-containing protein n=1 Tax=Prymnesium parvum TaxID=97485 RepID=A0AB34JF81_PRYPA
MASPRAAAAPPAAACRPLLAAALALWVAPPFAYLFLHAPPPLHPPPASPHAAHAFPNRPASASPSLPLPSRHSCAELRSQHGAGSWEPLALAPAACSELRRLPGGGGECPAPKVWVAAHKLCAKLGARLCTSDELLRGAARRVLGCTVAATVWSGSRCGVGGSNYLVEWASGEPGAALGGANATRPFAGGVANCDMSAGRHQGICCADRSPAGRR